MCPLMLIASPCVRRAGSVFGVGVISTCPTLENHPSMCMLISGKEQATNQGGHQSNHDQPVVLAGLGANSGELTPYYRSSWTQK